MIPLHPVIEAQCFIAGCMLHRSGYELASPIPMMLASDLSKPLPERIFLGGWGDGAGVWDVDISDAEDFEQMMERAAPVLAALHQGMVLGPGGIANHMRALFDRGDTDIWGAILLYQNCTPFMRDQRGVSARAKRAMRELLDEIINEPDAVLARFVDLAAEASHVTKRWSEFRLRGTAIPPVLEQRDYFLQLMQSLVGALNDTAKQMQESEPANGVIKASETAQSRSSAPSETATHCAPASSTRMAHLAAPPSASSAAPAADGSTAKRDSGSSGDAGCALLVILALGAGAAYMFLH